MEFETNVQVENHETIHCDVDDMIYTDAYYVSDR